MIFQRYLFIDKSLSLINKHLYLVVYRFNIPYIEILMMLHIVIFKILCILEIIFLPSINKINQVVSPNDGKFIIWESSHGFSFGAFTMIFSLVFFIIIINQVVSPSKKYNHFVSLNLLQFLIFPLVPPTN